MWTYIDKVYEMVQKETGLKSKETLKMYTLLALVKGEETTLSDVHDGWSMVMNYKEANPPYCYGHDHKSLVPFDQLRKETQDRDIKYVEAIHKVAKELKRMPKINVEMEIDEQKAFELLLKTLHVDLNEDIKENAFDVEDGEIVVKDYDDRGELYLALYHLATKIFPNTYFRSMFDDPNSFMSGLYIKKDMMR